MDRIQFDRDDIKCYLEETDERGRKVNTNYSERENDFIKNIKGITTLKNSLDEETGFFEILRKLDKMMLGEESYGRTVADKYGYLSEAEVEEILKWIFVERYVVAHAEDNTDEKPMNTALQDFISDKYDSGVHFFEEILQNIDDAIGRTKDLEDEDNKVEISWKDKKIIFKYPDKGFSFYDLMAITSLGNSIKKGDLEHASIGEKGIGFKSVFSVAKQVDITSKYFSFGIKYDGERKASVLQPDYIELNGTNGTVLKITFSDKFAIEDEVEKVGFRTQLRNWLFENKKENYLNYSPFLFLKNVKKIYYSEDNKQTEIVINRNAIEGTELFSTNIKTNINNEAQFLLYRSSLQFNKTLIANRWGEEYLKDKDENYFIDRPIEIAFPIVMDGEKDAKEKKGLFYSFLPTEMVIDNPIYINVDVHLKSSRGRISESDFKDGSDWNEYVLNNLQNALEAAYMAVIKNKDNETVWKVAKKLYFYMQTKQNTGHYFGSVLKKFDENIKNKEVYLNCKKEFVKNCKIWSPNITNNEKWNDFVAFCLGYPFPKSGIDEMQYSYDFEWFLFSKSQYHQNDDNWMGDLINKYKGIENFYNSNYENDKNKKNEIVLWLLKGAMQTQFISKSEWKILFVEDEKIECGYRISSKKEIEESDEVIFFHNTSEDIDDDLSIYINENVFDYDKQKKKYREILSGFVSEKDWVAFVKNKLNNLKDRDDISVEICFNETYKYVSKIKDINTIQVPEEIRELASKVVLPVDVWGQDEREKVYLMRITEYLTNQSCEGYRLFEQDTCEWQNKKRDLCYKYLICLGCKAHPEIIENSYDALTKAIMPDYANTTTDSESLLFVFDGDEDEKKLKKYLVDFSCENDKFDASVFKNFPFEKVIFINPDILQKGFIIPIQITGPRGGTTEYPEYSIKIKSFTQFANDDYLLFNGKKEKISINSGQVIFASNKYVQFTSSKNTLKFPEKKLYISYDSYDSYYKSIYYSSEQEKIIKKVIQSVPKDMLNKIRWISIWNKVFSVDYKWQDIVNMKIEHFLSCYEYIGREDIYSLFNKGYKVEWPDNKYYNGCVTDEVKEYLCGEFETDKSRIEDIVAKKYCAIEVRDFEKDFLVLKEGYEKLKNKGNYTHLIFISEDSKTKKTDYVIKILKTINISLNDAQQKELCDILDEIGEEKKKKIVELQDVCFDFSECIFNDDSNSSKYSNILEGAKKQLPSVWKKNKNTVQNNSDWSIKNWLCEPYKTEGFVFQGYGYQCPICGSLSKIHSLSGLKFLRRLKNSDINSKEQIPYLHLITCLNCADMIEGAKKIAIKDYDGKNLVESIKHFEEVCYCADQYHMYNNSKMKTMKLIMEIDEQEFCMDIKVSFLHLVLFAKLLKNT